MAAPKLSPHVPMVSADLSQLDDRTELSDDDEWSEVEVRGDFSGQSACDVEVHDARFNGARFIGTELERLHLTDVIIEGCDWSGALMEAADFTRVAFRDCRMSGTVLMRARLRDVTFERCRLDGANLRMLEGERVRFVESMMSGADLYGVRLPSTRFLSCDMQGIELTNAVVKGARFHGSTLDGITGGLALSGIVIDSTQLLPVAQLVLGALGIVVDDDPDPDD